MRTVLRKIGNSQGVLIPAALLSECGLRGEVDLSVDAGRLIISALPQTRAGWAVAAEQIAAQGEDESVWPVEFDEESADGEWTW